MKINNQLRVPVSNSGPMRFLHAAVRVYHRLPSPRLKRLIQWGWNRLRPQNYGRVVTATIDGIVYELHLDELIDSSIYYTGRFEGATTDAIRRLCRPGMVIFDIGANVGCHALRMAQLIGSTGHVFAFEPMPWANRKIRKNLLLNQLSNVTIENIALSDKACVAAVHFRSSWKLTGEASSAEAEGSKEAASRLMWKI